MELWWKLRGWVRMRLTSADCVSRLQSISRETRLEHILFHSDLEVEFDVLRSDVKKLAVREGETLEFVRAGGFPVVLENIWRWRLLA